MSGSQPQWKCSSFKWSSYVKKEMMRNESRNGSGNVGMFALLTFVLSNILIWSLIGI
ncbi:hypothetical protein GALMADRAFT_813474 [Galerina marginata CBS 339.88]|uniref:Uncharacterized protein n=1 Tax=Galerina marginata (strain CBS 339.88) TaxID=685588 RepID=A0A067SJ55_GALM3|nr:hypothetical protein GALMADRAFT_813474 [Galerina marginata CBS 339.88]